jgi:formate-dependent nitrite reductase membrane component NrfD
MKAYEWMVKYTPQTDWIKGGGIVVWLSFFTGIVGSGAYLASLYFNNFTGMVISWIIITVLKGGLHVGHAKNPLRLWRIVLKVRSSWLARGTVFTGLVAIFGFVQIALSYYMPGTDLEFIFKILTGASAVAIIIYEGFTLNYISGIPFWNSSLLPVTFISWGILNGISLIGAIAPGGIGIADAAAINRIILCITAIFIIIYLWNAFYIGATARESVRELTHRPIGFLFWIGAILIGIIVPLIILFGCIILNRQLAVMLFVCEIIGSLSFTYCIFKVGVYRPLI